MDPLAWMLVFNEGHQQGEISLQIREIFFVLSHSNYLDPQTLVGGMATNVWCGQAFNHTLQHVWSWANKLFMLVKKIYDHYFLHSSLN